MTVKELDVQQIEKAITQLPLKELAELVSWLEEYHAQVWDKQIEEDLEAGRLDKVLAEVEEEYTAGLTKPL
jgi:hypothetical protein